MEDLDAKHMMQRCSEEIRSLRARIAHLEPKAHAYDTLSAVLGLLPRPSQCYGEDLAWRLDKEIAEIDRRAKDKTVTDDVLPNGDQIGGAE